jgi:hypothetical protein
MEEGTCFLCFYRIHGGQPAVAMRVGGEWRLVHRHHAAEGKIRIVQVRRNIVDEFVEECAGILVRHNIVDEVVEELAEIL